MYKLPNCHLSELDVDIDGASLEVQLHHDGAEKTEHRKGKKPQANQSRYRRPTPYSVEHYRHEGATGAENDKSSDELPRGRSRSSTFTPTRTRAPTPHPHAHAHKSQKTKTNKTVRFTHPLEPQSPIQKGETATAPPNRKSSMKREPESQKREEKPMEKEKGRAGKSSEAHATHHIRVAVTPNDVHFCTLRRNTDRRSSVPRPKFAVSGSNATSRPITAPERPIIPQAVPASLRFSERRSQIPTFSASASAPSTTSSDSHIPMAARNFSLDNKPEIFTVHSHSAHKSRHTSVTKDSFSPPPSTSYLQTKPKRNGTILPPTVKTEHRLICDEDSGNIKKCSSASSVQTREIKPTGFAASGSTSSYVTAKSHLSTTNSSDTDTDTPSSMAASSTSVKAEYIPSLQSELWNTITNFCRSDASSVSPGEQYCDCDDCVWGEERDVAGCSTVARAGEENCRARRL